MESNFTLITFIANLLAFFLALTFHEFSHALAAYELGDNTAKNAGRLSLNPLVHLDLLGMLCFFLFRIGWAKPVPMNVNNFKYPRLYAVLCALAGPLSNFIFALVALYALSYMPKNLLATSATAFFTAFFVGCARINVMLGVFNILPIPPLDGGHIINALIPTRYLATYYRLLPFSIILLLIFLSFEATNTWLLQAINGTLQFLQGLVV